MTGPGVGQPARLAATGEYVFAHAGQLTRDWGQVVGQGCRAGCVHLVGNGQLAPHKIDIGPFQRGHFTPGATWQQGPRVGARASVAQLLHARPPAGHLRGLRGLRSPNCSTPDHQPSTCAASGVCGCPTAPRQTTSRPPARPPGSAVAQLLHTRPPAVHLRGLQDVGALGVCRQVFQNGSRAADLTAHELTVLGTGSTPLRKGCCSTWLSISKPRSGAAFAVGCAP